MPDRERRRVARHKQKASYKRTVKRVRRVRARREAEARIERDTRRRLKRNTKLQRAIKLADKKVDRDTHIGPFNIEAELEGRGGISKAAEFIKKKATTSAGQGALRAAGVPQLGSPKLQKNLTKDLVDMPAQAIPSAYALGAGAVEAAQGRPQRIKKLGKTYAKTDPVALAAQGKFKEAGKQVEKHPGLAIASAYGTGAAVSRVAGSGVRGAAKVAPTKRARKTLRRVGTTKRAPRVAPGTGIKEQRTYSKGLGGKAVQVAVEQTRVRSARRLRKKAKKTRDPDKKAALRDQANRNDPRIMSPAQINRRVDEREGMAHARQQKHRAQAVREADKTLPKKRADISLLAAQGVTKASRKGLEKLKRELDAEYKKLPRQDKARRSANRRLQKQVVAALQGKKTDFEAIQKGAKDYAAVVGPKQKELVRRGVLAPESERMAKLIPVAVKEMGAKWNPKLQRLELDGEKLPVKRIEAYLRSTGRDPKDFVYVPQAPGQRGAKNFYQSWHTPKGIPSVRRTGEATRKGTFEVSREVGRENVARQQGLIDAHNEYAGFISEQAYHGPRGKGKPSEFSFNSHKEAVDWGRENLADSPYEWTAVPTRPQFGRKSQSEALLDQADAMDVNLSTSVRDGILEALEGKSGSGKWVLVPKTAATRLSQHTRLLGSTGTKLTRKVGRQFSGTVLTTSGFTWPLGNVAEATLRATIKRAGPSSLALGHKTIRAMRRVDREMADELEARIGTGHLGAYELNHIHSTAKDFQGQAFLGPVARATGAFFRAPGPKQLSQLWNGWTHYIFGGNGMLEHQFRTALLGRYLRDQGYSPKRLFPKEGTNAISKAAEQAARGMRGTNEQALAARWIDRAYGRYSNFSPNMRFTIAVFTPFVAWSLNAVKFMVDVLPRDHPVLTGLIASTERATEEWRNEMGLGKFIDGAAPNWMQPSIPVNGKLVPVGRYTPFGFWADPLETSGSLILPAISGVQMASKGLDWKGDPLAGYDRADDVPEDVRAAEMAKSLMRSTVPFFGLQERVREKGKVAVNPLRSYDHNRKVTAAFDEIADIEAKKAAIKKKRPKVDSNNPTPEYARLHRRWRKLQELIHKESGGKYGTKFKEPYAYGGGGSTSSGGSWVDDLAGGGSAPAGGGSWVDQYAR
jgi:hypothetical protein